MTRYVRDGMGLFLVVVALGVIFFAIRVLVAHDYVATIILVLTGLSLLRAGVELLRPTLGE